MADYLFRSDRLGFRGWHPEDLAPMTAINQDPTVMQFFPALQDEDTTRQFIDSQQRCLAAEGCCFFATDLVASGRFIGFIGFKPVKFDAHFTPAIEIGWRLNKDVWGQGLATEGALANLSYAFDSGIEKIHSFTTISNTRSERVMVKIGMTKCGEFDHPAVPEGHALKRHILYEISRST